MYTTNQEKKQRDADNANNENIKRFKSALLANSEKQKECNKNEDISELKTDVKEIKSSIQHLTNTITVSLSQLTDALTTLTCQVNELKEQNKEKDVRMQKMETKVNLLEQQLISKNIEVNNIQNKEIDANEIIKTIAASVNVEINNNDISNAYHLKKKDKVIIEFCSLNKKRELMGKIKRHRVNGDVINNNKPTSNNNNNNQSINSEENNTHNANNRNFVYISGRRKENENHNNYSLSSGFCMRSYCVFVNSRLPSVPECYGRLSLVYINEQLTAHNRYLLWLAKTKAKESEWKFVWARNGHIFAKKNENSAPILISNSTDIESIA